MIGSIQMDNAKTTMIFMLEITPNCANLSELVKVQKPTAVVRLVRNVTEPMRLIIVNNARILF